MKVNHFDLAKTLAGGQTFMYYPEKKGFVILVGDTAHYIEQKGNELFFDCDESFLRHYFSLDVDTTLLAQKMTGHKMGSIYSQTKSIRLLRQDLWEVLLTFLLASNANMKKIKDNLHNLCKTFGKPIRKLGKTYYALPQLGSLQDYAKIVNCGVGYRADFIFAANGILSRGWLDKLKTLRYAQAKEALMDVPGIGSKVADCICLYGLQHWNAFPVDVWIKRALEELYFNGKEQPVQKLEQFAAETFGENRGWVQQYLFEWRRNLQKHKTSV